MERTNQFTFDPSVTYLFIAETERLATNKPTDIRINIAKDWLQCNDISLAEYIHYHHSDYNKYILCNL